MQIARVPATLPNRLMVSQPASQPTVSTKTVPVATPTQTAPVHANVVTAVVDAAQSLFERIVRDIQNAVNLVNDGGSGVITGVVAFQNVVANPTIYALLLHFPLDIGKDIKWLANSRIAKLFDWVAENPWFKRISGIFYKVAPVLGLVCAPWDIRNCIAKWHDPKATELDKVCTSIRLSTGIAMCVGGVLGFVLPWAGLPTAGAMALNVAGKIGLVNLAASVPSLFDSITGAGRWVVGKVKNLV